MKRFRILLLLVVIGGASLRLFAIGAKGLWLDEALSWRLAQFPVSMMIERTGESTTVHPPLYFVLLRAWTASFGDSEAALRSLSAVAGILAVLAVYFLAAELASFVPRRYGPCVWRIRVCSGVLAATFLALSPLHVYLAKQARGYTLATLWFVLCSWALLRGLPVGSRGWHRSAWLLYALGALAFCYTHYLGLFSVAAQGLFVALYLWAPGWRRRLRGPASAADAEGDCSLPSAPVRYRPGMGVAGRSSGSRKRAG
ncbi:MAG TPA: hypothetical protein EYP56_08230, partial [Planctomycetaceae bacterium]|nr:hypothetical protein [Planctomycetaceae bacterium]